MVVIAAIEAIQSKDIYVVLQDDEGMYHWLRAQPGQSAQGPFASLSILFNNMTLAEGKPAHHFERVFQTLYPSLKIDNTTVTG